MGSGFLGNLNHIAFQVPHLKVVRALTILLKFSDTHTPRTQDLSRLRVLSARLRNSGRDGVVQKQ
jgi:hypothetical protein